MGRFGGALGGRHLDGLAPRLGTEGAPLLPLLLAKANVIPDVCVSCHILAKFVLLIVICPTCETSTQDVRGYEEEL